MESIPAWTASTEFEVRWLLKRASISAALALVDLSGIAVDRADEVAPCAALATEAALPTILVGAIDDEASSFGLVVASVPTDVRFEELIAAVRVRT